ncbi:MAG: hypothetical protein ACOZJX_08220 [Pseudomonadota bacterium]
MQHTSIIQVLKVDNRKGTSQKTGRPFEIETAECILYADDGTVGQVGVLDVPPDLRGKVVPGTYTAAFSMRAAFDTRRIQSVLTGLTAVPPAKPAKA